MHRFERIIKFTTLLRLIALPVILYCSSSSSGLGFFQPLAQGPGEARHDIAAAPGPYQELREHHHHKPYLPSRPSASGECRFQLNHTPPWLLFDVFRQSSCFYISISDKQMGPNEAPRAMRMSRLSRNLHSPLCRRAPLIAN